MSWFRVMSWFRGEPTLDEMLRAPTAIAMMKRDGVDPSNLRVFLQKMSGRLNRSPDATTADPVTPCGKTTPRRFH